MLENHHPQPEYVTTVINIILRTEGERDELFSFLSDPTKQVARLGMIAGLTKALDSNDYNDKQKSQIRQFIKRLEFLE